MKKNIPAEPDISKARQKITCAIGHLRDGVWIPDIISLLQDAAALLEPKHFGDTRQS